MGQVGVKVWLNRGEILPERKAAAIVAEESGLGAMEMKEEALDMTEAANAAAEKN